MFGESGREGLGEVGSKFEVDKGVREGVIEGAIEAAAEGEVGERRGEGVDVLVKVVAESQVGKRRWEVSEGEPVLIA